MTLEKKLTAIGNSWGVIISKEMLAMMDVNPVLDNVSFQIEPDGSLRLKKAKRKDYTTYLKNALAFFKVMCYNGSMDKLFQAEFTNEAFEQLCKLEKSNLADYKKIVKAIAIFENFGKDAGNSRPLKNGLFEIKADQVRAYYKYHENSVIIVGIIVLKKTQKAPEFYIKQAVRNIERYLQIRSKDYEK